VLNSANLKARRPTSVELRARVVAAIDEFIAGSNRREWVAAFSSDQFHLVIDDEHEVSIAEMATPTAALYLFSIPLGLLPVDPWAVELGGGVKAAALDAAAQSVIQAFKRPKWWVA
jgi:hypothetical protein